MNRVLVHIPKNSVNGMASMRFSSDRAAADEMVAEGRIDKNSHYAGATIVPLDQWALHRFIESETGDPVQDPDSESMTTAELKERAQALQAVEAADVETVGDLDARLAQLADSVAIMQSQIDKRDETILAQAKQLDAEKERAATLGKPKTAATKAK